MWAAARALVRVTEVGPGPSSGPGGLEATAIETRVGPSYGDGWERVRSVLRKNRLTFKRPFGVVIEQAF